MNLEEWHAVALANIASVSCSLAFWRAEWHFCACFDSGLTSELNRSVLFASILENVGDPDSRRIVDLSGGGSSGSRSRFTDEHTTIETGAASTEDIGNSESVEIDSREREGDAPLLIGGLHQETRQL